MQKNDNLSIRQATQSQFVVKCALNQAVMLGVIDFRGEVGTLWIGDVNQLNMKHIRIRNTLNSKRFQHFGLESHVIYIASPIAARQWHKRCSAQT